MLFGKIFPVPEVKLFKKHSYRFLEEFDQDLVLNGSSGLQEIKSHIRQMAGTREMLDLLTDDVPPNIEYQALHSIGQVIVYLLEKPPLVDIGQGLYCSARLRDVMGSLTEEGSDLKKIAYAVVDKIIENEFEDRESEYVTNFLGLVNDATRPNINRHISGY